ncbi:MAG: hypothetical protein V8Q36_03940 [Anaerotignum sp.]
MSKEATGSKTKENNQESCVKEISCHCGISCKGKYHWKIFGEQL